MFAAHPDLIAPATGVPSFNSQLDATQIPTQDLGPMGDLMAEAVQKCVHWVLPRRVSNLQSDGAGDGYHLIGLSS